METRTIAIAGTIIFTLIFSAGFTAGWFFASPPPTYNTIQTGNRIRINLGLVPMDMYGVDLSGWILDINFDGYYDKTLDAKLDYYIATNGKTSLEDYSLSGIIRQIKNSQ